MNLAIITARGGSKRIPRKNIKEFLGKPIISYPIETAIKSNLFDEVMVSTDDFEIAEIAKKYGAKVPFMRSKENSDDFSTTADVILETLCQYEKLNTPVSTFCCIYPTSPCLTSDVLKNAFSMLSNCDAVVPVVEFSFSPYRSVFINSNEQLAYKYPEYSLKRSQDLEKLYHDAGQFYFGKTEIFKDTKSLIPTNTKPYILSELQVQDIDTETDWKLAELKYKLLHSKE